MLQDRVSHVAGIFHADVPIIDYKMLPTASVRNRLLAHYLVESLPYTHLAAVIEADTGKECVPKLAILDDARLLLGYSPVVIRAIGKENVMLGSLLPGSSLDKVVAMVGLQLFKSVMGNGKEKTQPKEAVNPARQLPDKEYLMQHEAFTGVSDGANPEHAAACYLQLLLPDPRRAYDARVGMSTSPPELRRLLAFKQYHDRTVLAGNRKANMAALTDSNMRMDEVFVRAVINWNRDILQRFTS